MTSATSADSSQLLSLLSRDTLAVVLSFCSAEELMGTMCLVSRACAEAVLTNSHAWPSCVDFAFLGMVDGTPLAKRRRPEQPKCALPLSAVRELVCADPYWLGVVAPQLRRITVRARQRTPTRGACLSDRRLARYRGCPSTAALPTKSSCRRRAPSPWRV
jgi:hypothetical protein